MAPNFANDKTVTKLVSQYEDLSRKVTELQQKLQQVAQKANPDAISAMDTRIHKIQRHYREFDDALEEIRESISSISQVQPPIQHPIQPQIQMQSEQPRQSETIQSQTIQHTFDTSQLDSLSGRINDVESRIFGISDLVENLQSDSDSTEAFQDALNDAPQLRSLASRLDTVEETAASQPVVDVSYLMGTVKELIEKLAYLEMENKQLREDLRVYNSKMVELEVSQKEKLETFRGDVNEMHQKLDDSSEEMNEKVQFLENRSVLDLPGDISSRIQNYVHDQLEIYSADKTNEIDYALASSGASVITTSGEFLPSAPSMSGWMFKNIDDFMNPRDLGVRILTADMSIGSCYPLAGAKGFIDVELSKKVIIERISIEHISARIAPNRETMPRNFRIRGYREHEWDILGTYEYLNTSTQLQTFDVDNSDKNPYKAIRLEIESNYGSEEYTCIYRLRVHGQPEHV